jgi:hypothetical protein
VIKTKLEAVESGITEFEAEFYAHTVLPGGQTVYEATREQGQCRTPPIKCKRA